MARAIAIIGTLDTKGDQIEYLSHLVEDHGCQPLVIDIGILGEPPFEPAIDHNRVAEASGASLKELIALNNANKAQMNMGEGAANIVKELYANGKLAGVIAFGGSMGTAATLVVMKALPLGIPKLIVSTIAFSPLVDPDAVCGDLMMMPWAGGLWGLNSMVKGGLQTAAAAITGAAKAYEDREITRKKAVAITSLGSSRTRYLRYLKPALEKRGYEVVVFHSTGMGGRVLEQAIAEGSIDVVLDLGLHELLGSVTGSLCSAGEHRMETAGKRGIPQIVATGSTNWFFWPGWIPIPPRFRNRIGFHNPLTGVVQAKSNEKTALGKLIAEKLNKATGPTAVVIPMKEEGIGPGTLRRLPKGGGPCAKALKANLKPEVKVIEIDANRNDPQFADTVLVLFDEMVSSTHP